MSFRWTRRHISTFGILVLLSASGACRDSPAPAPGTASPEHQSSGDAMTAEALSDHRAEVDAWHAERIANLRDEQSWLTLVGLFWLEDGENTFGSASGNDLVFPETAPAFGGALRLEDGRVVLEAAPEAGLTLDGEPIAEPLAMASDLEETVTRVYWGRFNFYVIDRGGRLGIRLKDREAETYRTFEGIDRFDVDPAFRYQARWDTYDPPKVVQTPNILGQVSDQDCPGAIVFEQNGQTFRLEPTAASDGQLFLVFGDASNGKDTYGGGRFLYLDPPVDGGVILDFNRSYNPPCVFSPYATCPLPRGENKLPFAVKAGEKVWGEQHDPV